MSGEPWPLVEIFLKDFLRDVGGTFGDVGDISRGMSGEPPGASNKHRPRTSKNTFRLEKPNGEKTKRTINEKIL